MTRNEFIMILAGVSITCGLAGLIGWVLGNPYLLAVHPAWVTMKPPTAMYCILAGLSLVGLRHANRADRYYGAGTSFALAGASIGLLFMAWVIPNDMAELPFATSEHEVLTVSSGEPSFGTFVGFALIGMSGLLLHIRLSAEASMGYFVAALIGFVGLCGYALQSRALVFYKEGVSTAMALHTAIACLCVGIGGILMSRGSPE